MLDLLRDGVWQFVGVLISVVALIVAISAIWIQVRKKSLVYNIESDNDLLSRKEILGDHVTVQYDGVKVSSLRLLSISFVNDGYVSISKLDFEASIFIIFPNGTRILAAFPANPQPESLQVEVEITSAKVSVFPLLLNKGDRFTIQIILTGSTAIPKIGARVLGVKEVKKQAQTRRTNFLGKIGFEFFTTAVALAILGFIYSGLSVFVKLLK